MLFDAWKKKNSNIKVSFDYFMDSNAIEPIFIEKLYSNIIFGWLLGI